MIVVLASPLNVAAADLTNADSIVMKTATAPAAEMTRDAAADSLMFRRDDKNFWRATGQTVGINVLVWSFNRFLRDSGQNPGFRIGFNSWENNQRNGFEWDDNSFATNQFAHPYHGSLYFNSGRANGYDYWESMGFAFAGSYLWEYVFETHHPSYNDWISTSVGGAALGESLYRLSSMVFDNRATGSERTWREISGTLINPMRGVKRLITGRAFKVGPNPSDRYASKLQARYEVGLRATGEQRLWEADTTRVYMRANFRYGDPFAGDRKRPFDTFDFDLQLNFGDASGIGHAEAKGLLFATELAESENAQHLLGAYQHYEYVNTNAYEFGGQSFSASYLSRIGAGATTLRTALHLSALLMGGTKSDYENFTGRSYDYGPGAGFKFEATLLRDDRPWFSVGHSSHWIYVVNGDRAEHLVAFTFARLNLPLRDRFGVNLEYVLYNAERHYKDFPDVSQRSPELRIAASWTVD